MSVAAGDDNTKIPTFTGDPQAAPSLILDDGWDEPDDSVTRIATGAGPRWPSLTRGP